MSSGGVAIECEPDGTLRRIVRDDLALLSGRRPGTSIESLFHSASRQKAGKLLDVVARQTVACDWELMLDDRAGDRTVPLTWAGVRHEAHTWLLGAKSRRALAGFIEGLGDEAPEEILIPLRGELERLRHRDEESLSRLGELHAELARVQRELIKRNTELEQLQRSQREFLRAAAHDLRNPLTTIVMIGELLETRGPELTREEQDKHFGRLRHTANLMRRVLNDLLDFAAMEAGQLRLRKGVCDLRATVVELIEDLRPRAEKRDVAVRVEAPTELGPVTCDRDRIEQVLYNIIGNALKFSPEGTEAVVAIEPLDSTLRISVLDRGPGIPDDQKPDIFKPFPRPGAPLPKGADSTGLGLAIAARLVRAHDGQIGFEDRPGGGTVFWLELPEALVGGQ